MLFFLMVHHFSLYLLFSYLINYIASPKPGMFLVYWIISMLYSHPLKPQLFNVTQTDTHTYHSNSDFPYSCLKYLLLNFTDIWDVKFENHIHFILCQHILFPLFLRCSSQFPSIFSSLHRTSFCYSDFCVCFS